MDYFWPKSQFSKYFNFVEITFYNFWVLNFCNHRITPNVFYFILLFFHILPVWGADIQFKWYTPFHSSIVFLYLRSNFSVADTLINWCFQNALSCNDKMKYTVRTELNYILHWFNSEIPNFLLKPISENKLKFNFIMNYNGIPSVVMRNIYLFIYLLHYILYCMCCDLYIFIQR